MASKPAEITRLLQQWRAGDRDAESHLFELLMPDLRKMADRYFRNERRDHTLQPTALINEAFLRLVRTKNIEWNNRSHFFAIAATIMRRYLIDYARARPNIERLTMDGVPDRVLVTYNKLELAVAVDALLDELERESPQRRSIVELKFFLGLTDEETAQALNLTLHTLQREWARARRWLFQRLNKKS